MRNNINYTELGIELNDLKKSFLHYIEHKYVYNTYIKYRSFIFKVAWYEQTFSHKDLSEFTFQEVVDMLKFFNADTETSLNTQLSIVRKYMEVAVIQGYISNNLDILSSLTKETLSNFINSKAKEERYLTKKELLSAVKELKNPQDKIIFLLIFDGIMGKAYKDLINLKVEDYCTTNHSIKVDDKWYKLSRETEYALRYALEQDVYFMYYKENDKYIQYKLNSNDPYIIRSKKSKVDKPISTVGIRRRIDTCREYMNKEYVHGKTVWLSGIAHRLIELERENQLELVHGQIKEYCNKENINTNIIDMIDIIKIIKEKHKQENELA